MSEKKLGHGPEAKAAFDRCWSCLQAALENFTAGVLAHLRQLGGEEWQKDVQALLPRVRRAAWRRVSKFGDESRRITRQQFDVYWQHALASVTVLVSEDEVDTVRPLRLYDGTK